MGQRLGQHWLKNKAVVEKIVASLQLKKGETIIEIGPGRGALTWPLLKRCAEVGCRYIGIERDEALARELEEGIRKKEKGMAATIITGDVLHALPTLFPSSFFDLPNGRYKLVGNLPYYITGKILRTISELGAKPSQSVLMMQQEVGERLAAAPPKMNLLAAATQIWAEPRMLFNVPAKDFIPPPKVNSTVVELRSGKKEVGRTELQGYYELIHAAFKQPRKMLINNLASELKIPKEKLLAGFEKLGISEKARAQDLSIEQLLSLSIALQS